MSDTNEKMTPAQKAAQMIENAKNTVASAAPAKENLAATKTGKKPGTASVEKDGEGRKWSPKSKEARGIDPSLITTWVPSDNSAELNEILNNAAKFRDENVGNMMANILKDAIAARLDELKADAAKYTPATKGPSLDEKLQKMSPQELEAFITKQQQAMEALVAKVASMKK